MHATEPPPTTPPSRTARFLLWIKTQRRAAAGQMLRGICYGVGTGAVSLLTIWAEHRLT